MRGDAPSHLLIRQGRSLLEGTENRILTANSCSLSPEGGLAVRPGHRTRPLMYHTRDHVTPRRNGKAAPHLALSRRAEVRAATSLTVETYGLGWTHQNLTTDPVSSPSSRGGGTTELAGTPCGMGDPKGRVYRGAWGRLLHMLEVSSSEATWGRSLLGAISNQALKVRTWGRTTEARFLTRNPAGDVPNRTARLGVA